MKKIDSYSRNAVFAELEQFCTMAKEHDYIEITEWYNGEGFDVNINSTTQASFEMTWGQYTALKKLIKEIKANNKK
jgi:hypothetical protein